MPSPAIVVTALAAAVFPVAASVGTDRASARQPEGKIVVFVTEGSQPSWAGTRLREYDPSPDCQAFPPGAHVVANHSGHRLLFYSDPFCVFPVPPPFSFIPSGYGAHVSPSGSFRVG